MQLHADTERQNYIRLYNIMLYSSLFIIVMESASNLIRHVEFLGPVLHANIDNTWLLQPTAVTFAPGSQISGDVLLRAGLPMVA